MLDMMSGGAITLERERGDQSSLKLAQKATTVIKACIVVVSRISTVTRGGGRPICQPHYYHGQKYTHLSCH